MTDEWTIRTLQENLGVGTVTARTARTRVDGRTRKPTWTWSVQNHKDIKTVLDLVSGYFSPRRLEKAQELYDYIASREKSNG